MDLGYKIRRRDRSPCALAMAASASESWQPVHRLRAEFSPEVATLLSTSHGAGLVSLVGGRNEALRTKLNKHLLALGWRIVSKPNAGLAPRLRYDSPVDGKSFYSLPSLIRSGKLIHVRAPNHDDATDEDYDDNDEDYTLVNTDDDDDDDEPMDDDIAEPAEEEKRRGADAIAEYIDFMVADTRGQSPRAEQLRVKAKEQLVSSGWTFWMTVKYDGRQELRYKAPHGRSYISLVTACKAYQEMTNHAATTTPAPPRKSKSKSKSNKRRTEHATTRPAGVVVRVLRPRTGDGSNCTNGSSEEINTGDDCSNEATGECARSKKRRSRVSAVYADDDTLEKSTKKKKKVSASQARVLLPRPKDGESQALLPSACQRRARTLLSVLMDKNILVPSGKLTYKRTRDGPPMKEGLVTGDGTIKCMCGCNKAAFTMAEFEAHAGRSSTGRPWAGIFLKDGRSLSQCLLQLMADNSKDNASLRPRLKKRCSGLDGDSVCSTCHEGGELLLCDHCPSTFHHACVGLDATPEGDWFCPSCRCSICDSSDFDPDASRFTDKTVMFCDQCEREYHVGCVRNRGDDLSCCPEGPWLCSGDCSKIFQHLQGLVGRSIPTSVEGLSFTILRSSGAHDRGEDDEEAVAEQHGKLCVAFDVLHECFVTLIEPRTQSDLSADIVFNRESELRRLNFRGFYMIGLEKGSELITVGTLRVYGRKVAELPLVGTRFAHRRQGMCHLLMNQLEKLLSQLGVERLVLPAVPELAQTWTGSFGFKVMSQSDKLEIAEHTILCFQGTSMCQKSINGAPDV